MNYLFLLIRIALIAFALEANFSIAQDEEKETETEEKPVPPPSQTSGTTVKQVVTEELSIAVGLDKVVELDFPFSNQMNLGDPSLVRVEPDLKKRKITFIGLKQGNTSLTIKDAVGEEKIRYVISVSTSDQSKIVSQLRDLIGDIEGIEIGVRGGKVFVGGEIVIPTDIKKIATVLEGYPDVLRFVDMSPQTQVLIASEMQGELRKNNFTGITVRVLNNTFWVEGTISSEGETNTIKGIVEALLPEKIDAISSGASKLAEPPSKSSVVYFLAVKVTPQEPPKNPPPKIVKVSSQFVELSKDYGKVFGFKWAPQMGADQSSIRIGKQTDGTVTSQSSGTFSAVISNLFPKLQAFKNAGYARVIQSGMVIAKDRVPASVTKQTNTPFVVGSGESARSSEAKIGFDFGVTPTVLEDDNVELQLSIGVSVPSGQSSSGGLPIVTSNSVKTTLTLKSKETAVIGGVVQNQDLTAYDKNDPAPAAQGTVPNNLFLFLRSRSQNITRNQYVVFVTPEILISAVEGSEDIKNKFRKRGR
jgi:pilus assembly protein CpaC